MHEFKFREKLNLAASYENLNNNLHAIQIYTSLIEEDESYLETYIRLIKLYERTGRTKEAANIVDKMLTLNHKKDYAILVSAEFYVRHSFWEKAVEVLSILHSSDFPLIDYWRGLCFFKLKNFQAAKSSLNYYYEHCDSNDHLVQALFLLAQVEFELGNFETALEYLEKFEYFDSNNWEIDLLSAKIYYEFDMLTHAAIKIEKALKRKKRNSDVLEIATKIFFRLGEYDKAEKYFNILTNLTDRISAEVYSDIAFIAKEKKEYDKAKLYYQLALKINPGFKVAMNALNSLSSLK